MPKLFTNTFSANTKIKSAEVNQNFTDVSTVVLDYGEDTAGQIVTTEADLTNLDVTITAQGSRYVRISANVRYVSTDGPRNMTLALKEGVTQLQTHIWTASGASAQETAFLSYIFQPAAGAHTYKLTGNANGGTMTLQAAATAPNYIVAEAL